MTITYPRDFPTDTDFESVQFELQRFDLTSQSVRGTAQVMENAVPLWMAEYQVVPMYADDFQRFQAWLNSLRGGQKMFWGYDPAREYPAYYGASAPAASCTLATTVSSGFSIALSGLPSGYRFTAGDLVSVRTATSRSLHEVQEDVTATTSATITVEPRVSITLTSGAQVDLVRAAAKMRLVEKSGLRRSANPTGLTFSAMQVL